MTLMILHLPSRSAARRVIVAFFLMVSSFAHATEDTWHSFDRRTIERSEGVQLTVGEPLAVPVLLSIDGSTHWTRNNVHAIVQPAADGGYLGWRLPLKPVAGADDARVLLAMRSDDGIAWNTAPVPAVPMMAAVVCDERESNPVRRFKAVISGWGQFDDAGALTRVVDKSEFQRQGRPEALRCGVFSAVSPDGVAWTHYRTIVLEEVPQGQRWWRPGQPGWTGGDNFPCLFWAPTLKRWVCYFRTNLERGPGQRRERGVGRSASADFDSWEPHTLALHADTSRLEALGYGKQDYYQLQAWPVGNAFLGVLSVFYWDQDRVHLELAWSPDTRHWERIAPGRDLVPHGALGPPGAGCRYAALRPFVVGDRTRLYYGADDGRHNADPNRAGGLYLAEFPAHRLAGLKGTGLVLTRPLPLAPDTNPRSLRVEAQGAVTVRIVPAGDRQARLQFNLDNAILYSATWRPTRDK